MPEQAPEDKHLPPCTNLKEGGRVPRRRGLQIHCTMTMCSTFTTVTVHVRQIVVVCSRRASIERRAAIWHQKDAVATNSFDNIVKFLYIATSLTHESKAFHPLQTFKIQIVLTLQFVVHWNKVLLCLKFQYKLYLKFHSYIEYKLYQCTCKPLKRSLFDFIPFNFDVTLTLTLCGF